MNKGEKTKSQSQSYKTKLLQPVLEKKRLFIS
jgi:hypothetical protein